MEQVEQQLKLIITEGLHFWTNVNLTALVWNDLKQEIQLLLTNCKTCITYVYVLYLEFEIYT